jgi:pSer/pThr/pTyr-binding forkhead associated (FHA) protein
MRSGNDYLIEDLLSANGTFVNGKKLTTPQLLKDGDQISIGDTTLIFRLRWSAAAVPPANDQTFVAKQPAIALAAAAANQPKPPVVSSQPTGPMPTVAAPALVNRIAPKWIGVGVAGSIVLLLMVLLASRINPTPGLAFIETTPTELATTEPAPTESHSAAGAVKSLVTSTIRSTSTRPPTTRPTNTSVPDTTTPVPPTPTRTRVPPTRTPIPPTAVPPTDTPLPPPIVVENTYAVERCCGPTGTQMSDQLDYSLAIDTIDLLQLSFASDSRACSDARLHIFLDGNEIYTTEYFGAAAVSGITSIGWIDLSPVPPGNHTLLLRPEGRATGLPADCNTGTLGGWAISLWVRTNRSL